MLSSEKLICVCFHRYTILHLFSNRIFGIWFAYLRISRLNSPRHRLRCRMLLEVWSPFPWSLGLLAPRGCHLAAPNISVFSRAHILSLTLIRCTYMSFQPVASLLSPSLLFPIHFYFKRKESAHIVSKNIYFCENDRSHPFQILFASRRSRGDGGDGNDNDTKNDDDNGYNDNDKPALHGLCSSFTVVALAAFPQNFKYVTWRVVTFIM